MRENRTSGSEGGGTEQSVLPTPILLKKQTLHQHIEEHYQNPRLPDSPALRLIKSPALRFTLLDSYFPGMALHTTDH